MTTDLQRRLAEEAEASEAGRELDAVYHRNTQPAKEPSQVYSLRLPVERIGEIRALATQSATQPTTLIRRWVLERLDEELAGRGRDESARLAQRRAAEEGDEVYVMTRSELHTIVRSVVLESIQGAASVPEPVVDSNA